MCFTGTTGARGTRKAWRHSIKPLRSNFQASVYETCLSVLLLFLSRSTCKRTHSSTRQLTTSTDGDFGNTAKVHSMVRIPNIQPEMPSTREHRHTDTLTNVTWVLFQLDLGGPGGLLCFSSLFPNGKISIPQSPKNKKAWLISGVGEFRGNSLL